MKLFYVSAARIPSEKAHPFQITQMCDAFARNGADVTLLYRKHRNPRPLRVSDIWGYYGVKHSFTAEQLRGINIFPLYSDFDLPHRLRILLDVIAQAILIPTYTVRLLVRLAREQDAVVYSRDPILLAALAALYPAWAKHLFFEAHTYAHTGIGLRLRSYLAKRIGGFVVITRHLYERYSTLGVPEDRLLTAHDGFSKDRFETEGDRKTWRQRLNWPVDGFIVGYMGRFYTLGMGKGLDTLLEAIINLQDESKSPVYLGLVGGPAEVVEAMRQRLEKAGLDPELILYAGQVPAPEVPGYLRAFDVCSMPFPWTTHFAYYASPMKLFEYMASGTAVVASDLPSTAEIMQHEYNGLLTPPDDVNALSKAVRRLRADPALRKRLAKQALTDVQSFSWEARAHAIMHWIESLLS